jgi:transcriptional regulator with XRE-family HTH domain
MEKSVFTREYRVFLMVLRESRRAAGVTQVELARRLRQTQSQVSKFERGEVRLDLVQMRRVCLALGTTLSAFVRSYEKRLTVRK